jgi:hypothetical protein
MCCDILRCTACVNTAAKNLRKQAQRNKIIQCNNTLMISLRHSLSEVTLELNYAFTLKVSSPFNVESIGKGGRFGRDYQY